MQSSSAISAGRAQPGLRAARLQIGCAGACPGPIGDPWRARHRPRVGAGRRPDGGVGMWSSCRHLRRSSIRRTWRESRKILRTDGQPEQTRSDMDRPVKRRLEILIGRYTANPMMRGLFKLGITPPGMALVETIGRRSGAIRHTPVAYTPGDAGHALADRPARRARRLGAQLPGQPPGARAPRPALAHRAPRSCFPTTTSRPGSARSPTAPSAVRSPPRRSARSRASR